MTTSTIRRQAIVELDRNAGTEPLLNVAAWYVKSYFSVLSRNERLNLYAQECSANEIAARRLGLEDYQSEAEIATRARECIDRRWDVCECYATLKAARAALGHAPNQEPVPEPAPENGRQNHQCGETIPSQHGVRGDARTRHHSRSPTYRLVVRYAVPRSVRQ
jgi:hypothetical protein